jgi:hypothetical protein
MTDLVKHKFPADRVYAFPGGFEPAALAEDCVWFSAFGKKPGETTAQAARRSSWNRAPGAANSLPLHHLWPGGYPTFGANYAEFREDTPLVTDIVDFGSAGGCIFVICNCDDDTVGSDASHRAFIAGTFGGATNLGFGLEYASDAASTARATDYQANRSIQPNQMDFGVSTSDFEKIRLLYAETGRVSGGDQKLAAVNLSGDGTTPAPTPTTLTGGRATGSQRFSIGGRISDTGTGYTAAITKRIAAILIFGALPNLTERGDIAAQMRAIMTAMAITELSSSW